jgi:hypothetical protein
MGKQLKVFLLFIVITCAYFNSEAQTPKLIEFGWDYPDVDQLSKRLDSMQNTPFDGICFSLQRTIMEAFDTIVQKESYFENNKLKTLKWGKYSDNYIILRGFGITGGRWFDDNAWKVFEENMKALSRTMATNSTVKGILFDPEYYYENTFYNPWTFSKHQYPNQTLEEVQAGVKKRGTQFIQALQKYKTDLSFISIWITSLIAEERKYTPLQDTRHVLLLSFIEGVLEGKNKKVTVIDGNEYAYWNFKPSQFLESTSFLKKNAAELMKSEKAKSEALNMPIAQTLFYDGLMASAPSFEKGLDNETKWKWLEENTRYAMATTNSIVWFYSERLNWWQNKVNDTLVQILQNSKEVFAPSLSSKNKNPAAIKPLLSNSIPINGENGHYYYTNEKTPMKTGEVAFSFNWNTTTKDLQISFPGKLPSSINIYTNNTLFNTIIPKESILHLKVDSFKKGSIIVLAKYDINQEAVGIQTYQ